MNPTADGWRRLESLYVQLVALHSYAVAFFLLFLTRWGVSFGGWSELEPRQATG